MPKRYFRTRLYLSLWCGMAAFAMTMEAASPPNMPNDRRLGPIIMAYDRTAFDPSWPRLFEFLQQDQTHLRDYIPDRYVCLDFALALQHSATAHHLRAGLALLSFEGDDIQHAVVVFRTGMGLVYADPTGLPQGAKLDPAKRIGVAYIKVHQPYGRLSLDLATDDPVSYSRFEYTSRLRQALQQERASLRQEAEALEARKVLLNQPTSRSEYARLNEEYRLARQSYLDHVAAFQEHGGGGQLDGLSEMRMKVKSCEVYWPVSGPDPQ